MTKPLKISSNPRLAFLDVSPQGTIAGFLKRSARTTGYSVNIFSHLDFAILDVHNQKRGMLDVGDKVLFSLPASRKCPAGMTAYSGMVSVHKSLCARQLTSAEVKLLSRRLNPILKKASSHYDSAKKRSYRVGGCTIEAGNNTIILTKQKFKPHWKPALPQQAPSLQYTTWPKTNEIDPRRCADVSGQTTVTLGGKKALAILSNSETWFSRYYKTFGLKVLKALWLYLHFKRPVPLSRFSKTVR